MSSLARNDFVARPRFDQQAIGRNALVDSAEQAPCCKRQKNRADARKDDAFVGRCYPKKVIKLLALIPVGGSILAKRVVKHKPQSPLMPRASGSYQTGVVAQGRPRPSAIG